MSVLQLIPNKTTLLAFLLPLALVLGRWGFHGFDWSLFIVAGDQVVVKDQLPYQISVQEDSPGYDGQYFYRIALYPLSQKNNEFGIPTTLSYRKQRILYPAIAYLLTLGHGAYLPIALVLINLSAFFLFLYFARVLLQSLEISASYFWLFATQIGGYIALSRNLAELLALTLLVAAFYFFRKGNQPGLILATCLALLTREESILIVIPLLGYFAWQQYSSQRNAMLNLSTLTAPLIIFFGWKSYLYLSLGGYASKLSFPFQGIVQGLANNFYKNIVHSDSLLLHAYFAFYSLCLLWYLWTIAYAGKYISFTEKPMINLLSACWIIWVFFAPLLDYTIYEEEMSFGRVLASLAFISLLMIGMKAPRINRSYAFFSALIFALMFLRLIFFL